jgi:hypothetical protein
MRMSWFDPPGYGNFYRIGGELEEVTSLSSSGTPASTSISPADWEAGETLSDEEQDGQPLISPWGHWRRFGSQTFLRTTINAQLLHTDAHYYAYHRSLRRAQQSRANPFAEPVLLYSKITGGLGAFGAYTQTTTSVRIK